jgi:pre-mRNA-splicing factor 18
LRALELLEKTSGTSSQGFNDFNKLMKDMESGYEAREEEKKARAMHRLADENKAEGSETLGAGATAGTLDEKREREEQRRKVADQVLDLDLIKSDPQKLYPIIYYVLKVGLRLIWSCSRR